MSHKDDLRRQREGTVINNNSKPMESNMMIAVHNTMSYIRNKFNIKVTHATDLYLKDVVTLLRKLYPNVDFEYLFDTSSMRPDGGVVSITNKNGTSYPILIGEVKNQGTNNLRVAQGMKKQAKGNAIERLGKNVIGFRTALLHEDIFPFVCFGDGCDFAPTSSILDRVITISMFGKLNITRVFNEGPNGCFNRGSFYFRTEKWSTKEMEEIMKDVAERSVYYYFSKYGESNFI